MTTQPSTNPFAPPLRAISTHDPATGRAVFTKVPEEAPTGEMPCSLTDSEPSRNIRLYSTNKFPIGELSSAFGVVSEDEANSDFQYYVHELEHPQPLDGSNRSHTSCRLVELAPGDQWPMHRTITFDYGVVIDGVVEWELDSGEKKTLKKGDVSIQRGTAHAWKNVTPTEENNGWARMFFVMLSSEKVKVGEGKELGHGFGFPRLEDSENSPS